MTNPLYYEHNGLMRHFQAYLQGELDRAKGKHSKKLHVIWARERKDSRWVKKKRRRNGKELNADDTKPHYHALILVNGDAFNKVGSYRPTKDTDNLYRDNSMAHRVIRAWSSALGKRPHQKMRGLAHFCERYRFEDFPSEDDKTSKKKRVKEVITYDIRRRDGPEALVDVMYAASYLCKAYSKEFRQGIRCFQTTQISADIVATVWAEESEKGGILFPYGTPRALRQDNAVEEAVEEESIDLEW